jgi:hypothetical protein
VGPVLGRLNAYGAGAGILLGLLGWRLRRGPTLVILPLLAAALCLYSELGITPQIAALRPLAFGPEGSPESAARFRELHQLSVGIFLLVAAAVVVLVAAHAARDAPRGGGDPP